MMAKYHHNRSALRRICNRSQRYTSIYNSVLRLRSSHTFLEAVDIQYQNQELIQGMDCISLGVAAQMRLLKLYKR